MEVGAFDTKVVLALLRPENVSADRVFDFDIYREIPEGMDFDVFWREIMEKVPHRLMWTPHDDGHWIALTAELSDIVMSEPQRFSNKTVLVPKAAGEAYRLIPLSLDPPAHRPFRTLLNENLGPKPLKPIEQPIVDLSAELIGGFKDLGSCNFVEDFAEQLPVTIFMMLILQLHLLSCSSVTLSRDRLVGLAPSGPSPDEGGMVLRREYLTLVIAARRRRRRGHDLAHGEWASPSARATW